MYKYIAMLCSLSMLCVNSISAQQYKSISVEQAIDIATEQDPALILADLRVSQSEELSSGGVPTQAAQIFFSGDEFNFDGISGIQSLNIQQSFNLPKVSRTHQDYNKAKANRYEHQKLLTKKDIIRNVESAYYTLAIAKLELTLRQEVQTAYSEFLARSKEAYVGGESNKVALLTANNLLKKANLNIVHANHEIEVAREVFNIWLGNTGNYDVESISNEDVENWNQEDTQLNPHLGIYQYDKELVERKIEMQKSKLLPQINTGLRLQSLNGDLLYFGYQLGVNIPILRGGYNKQIEATRIGIDILESERIVKEREINIKTTKLRGHLDHVKEKINAYDTDLLPSIKEQFKLLKEAYQAGEGSYIEYMMSLENYNDLQIEKINLFEDLHKTLIELKYWTEVN